MKGAEHVWLVQGQPKAVLNPPQTEAGPVPDLVRLDAAPLWEVCTSMQPCLVPDDTLTLYQSVQVPSPCAHTSALFTLRVRL